MLVKLSIFILLLCIFTTNAKPYDDALARKILPLASAAYSDKPNQCIKNVYKDAELIQRYEPICDPLNATTCSGFLAALHSEKAIAVSFRGTNNATQFYIETYAALIPPVNFEKMGGAQYYFVNAFWYLWSSGMGRDFDQLVKKYPDYSVWVTGHSLGGALSSLASAKITKDYPKFNKDNSAHYNFGQPPIGDKDFVATHNKLLPDFYRIAHARDNVVEEVKGIVYVHHNTEVWYNNSMSPGSKYVICSSEKDPRCQRPLDSSTDHLFYFDTMVSQYGIQGCSQNNNKNDNKNDDSMTSTLSTSMSIMMLMLTLKIFVQKML